MKAIVDDIRVELPGRCETTDETAARRAYDRLASNLTVPLDRIHIAVEDGVVTLRGDVDWQFQREAAVADLRHLDCVRDIRNEIQLRPPVEASAIAERIRGALGRLGLSSASAIEVEATGSDVRLSGFVPSWHERDVAENVAWSVPGVSRVDNRLTVH